MGNMYKVSYEVNYNHFPKIAARAPQVADDIVARIVLMIVQVADPLTPVDTGNLKNNKTINTGGGGNQGFVHWHAPYTAFVENGTRYMPARPFIAPAVAQVQPIFVQAMEAFARAEGMA